MRRIFFAFGLLAGCSEYPWVLTEGLPDSGPAPSPGTPHICVNLSTDPEKYLTETFVQTLCANFPYAWGNECPDNALLMTCTEFFESLRRSCPNLTTCDYEECSKALQLATCGEYPQVCLNIAKCQPAERTPGVPAAQPTTGSMETSGSEGSSTTIIVTTE